MPRTKVFDAPFTGVNLRKLTSILGVAKENILGEWYADPRGAGSFYDLSGNGRHLAASSAVTLGRSTIVGHDGNLLNAFEYSGSNYHSLAHDSAWMNVFDGSFSTVHLIKFPSANPAGTITFFAHGVYNADGIYVAINNTGAVYASLSKAGATKQVIFPSSTMDGLYHVLHVVRNGDGVHCYLDGVPGAQVTGVNDGYGIDQTRVLVIGGDSGGTSLYTSAIAYTRLQNNALTYTQITREVAAFQGILCTRGGTQKYVVPTFIRSTTTSVPLKVGSTANKTVPANWPAQAGTEGVRIMGSSTQLLSNTDDFAEAVDSWDLASHRLSISATPVTLPDGSISTTAMLKEGTYGEATTYYFDHDYSATSGTTYCWSLYMKYLPGGSYPRAWVNMGINDGSNSKTYYFDVNNAVVGGTTGSLSGGYGIDIESDGWVRYWVYATAGATQAGQITLYICEADGDAIFTGRDQDSVRICWPQMETGTVPTPYVENTSTGSKASSGDFMVVCPWNITKNLGIAGQTPRLLFDGSESLNGATVTPTTGAYSFTKNGRPQNISSEAEGDGWKLNGSTDYLEMAAGDSGDFNPSGSFSIVVSYTPSTISGTTQILSKCGNTANYGWYLYQSTSGISFRRSTTGSDTLTTSVANCLEIGKPVLITASFSTSTGMSLWVDAFTVSTEATLTATYPANIVFCVGNSYSHSQYFNGRLHYLAYYDGYAATASDHSTNYARFKTSGILPLFWDTTLVPAAYNSMSSTTSRTKIAVEFDTKALYGGVTDNGGVNRRLLAIGGVYGTSGSSRNLLHILNNSTATNIAYLYKNTDSSTRYMQSAVRTDLNTWRRHVFTVSMADLSSSTYVVNGVSNAGSGMTGTGDISFADTTILIGAPPTFTGSVMANAFIRDLKLFVE